jgi:hypothetical protein
MSAAETEAALAAKPDLAEVVQLDQLCSVIAGTVVLWLMPALLGLGKQLWPSSDICRVAGHVRKHLALVASKDSYQVH